MKNYVYLGTTSAKKFFIIGVDVFSRPWRSQGECDIVLHPDNKQPYSFSIYRVETEDKTVEFLAGHFENDDWVFYKAFEESDIFF